MRTEPHFYPFEVHTTQMNSWGLSPKVFNFFEIIQVIDGEGDRYFNHIRLPYHAGQLFIYTPQDCRSFIIEKPTRFLIIRFADVLFANCESKEERRRLSEWLKKLEYLFLNHNHAATQLIKNSYDCLLVKSIMTAISSEASNRKLYSKNNIQHLLQVLLTIFARNTFEGDKEPQPFLNGSPSIHNLTGYIRTHIYEPDKLRIQHLASVAGASPTYIGEYFKKHTGLSIRNYILQYRLSLVKIRLQYSDLTISEIAHELNFTDESHLSNLFKKYFSDTPTSYRRKALIG
jgi:AraC-like DNA-binding protein